MKWFKHDSNANMDAKLQDVLLDYGLEGYGLYWYCIELISSKVDKDNITFAIEHDARIIARNTGSTTQKINEMMTRFVDLGLFENTDGIVTCMKLARRLDKSMTSNPEMRNVIDKVKNHDSVMTQSAKPMQDKNRLDKNRLDKSKEIGDSLVKVKPSRFTPPTVNEVREYCNERLNFVDAESFVDHYESNGWMRGKTKIKDWKACVRTWEKNAKPKQQGMYSTKTQQTIDNLRDI